MSILDLTMDPARQHHRLPPGWPSSPLLNRIGAALDKGLACAVYDKGSVWPAAEPEDASKAGTLLQEVRRNGAERTERATRSARSAAGARPRAAAGGPAQEPAAQCSPAPIFSGLRGNGNNSALLQSTDAALRAYPQFTARSASSGLWIAGPVQPVADLPVRVTIALYVSFGVESAPGAAAWAWWDGGVWIGPRHTNHADGSICAFEPRDATWGPSRGLLPLLDLHCVWVVKQLYLRAYGQWPGRQILHTAFERLTEHLPGELCGCGSDRQYTDCCRAADLHRESGAVLREFTRAFGGNQRRVVLPATD